MIRLSYIVPFYGVEAYIEECIRSLYNQDIPQSEYEVICVDDCSLDGSRAIVERLQKEYTTLKLLKHTENKRQGGARNTGLRVARGKYICFVDSDDFIKSNSISRLLEEAEKKQLDILIFESILNHCDNVKTTPILTGSQYLFDIYTWCSPLYKCSEVWGKLIKTSLIQDSNLFFAEKVQYEDDDFSYQLFAYASRVEFYPQDVYVVRLTPNSTTRRANDIRRISDIYSQALRLVELVPKLVEIDERWRGVLRDSIRVSFDNQIFIMLKDCSIGNQLKFWLCVRKKWWHIKPYLTHRSYIKLFSYIAWKILQK